MKLRKLISLAVIVAMLMASVGTITLPSVSAETMDTATQYSEDFQEYANTNYQNTLRALKDYGWYMADQDTLYTNVDTVAPYSTYSYKLAKIVAKDGSQCLQIVSAGETNSSANSDVPKYGYGKTFPGVEADGAATGIWEIGFDFKPALNNKQTQFAFTLNTGDGSASGDTAQHNIIAGYGQRFYLGYRNYKTLLDNGVIPDTLKAANIGGETWYRVRTILNCDAHYYSVELYDKASGKLIARRSPISFAADETIGFVKFSALGYSQNSWVFVDNVSIQKAAREATIYNETFDTFTNGSYRAADGMTTGTSPEDFTGDSYFEGNTPWRFHESIGNSYALEQDDVLSSQVVRLGDLPSTPDDTEASGLVYMQVDEPLITQATEPLRGTFKTSFRIKPETVVDDVTLNVIPGNKYDITNNNYAVFKIINNEGTPSFVKSSGEYVALGASSWYTVNQKFNVTERTVETVVKDLSGNLIASDLVRGGSTPNAIRALMFKVTGGSSVLMDDVKLGYYSLPPSVNTSRIVLCDRFGERITDTNNVPTTLQTIEIPMGAVVDSFTANSSTILLKDSNNTPVSYTGSVVGKSYIMELESVLGLNEEYTLTIPQTVANSLGYPLGEDVTFTFRTVNQPMELSAVSVDGEPLSSLSALHAGSTVSVTLSYANATSEAINSKVVFALYGNNKLLDKQFTNYTVPVGASGSDANTVTFTVPDLNMDSVDGVSVFLWDGFHSLRPRSRKISLEKAGLFKDYVDFEVNVESGRDAVILQITDPQIIDATQVREDVTFSQKKRDFWQPTRMNQLLFNDLRNLINEVQPDLILMTGDLVYGGYDDAGTSFTRLADFMDSFGIPWAPVFGNHDNESKRGVDWQCSYLESCQNCLFKQRTLTGNGNYSIGIVQGDELKRVIFMMDSNGCGAMSDESYANGHSKKSAGFGADQIEWYTAAANKINNDFDDIEYTFAFHIQPAVFEDALYNTYGFQSSGAAVTENGDLESPLNIDTRQDKQPTDFGYIGRKLKTPWDSDKAVYNGMKALGADSILVGHEHCNSASVVYDGVRFQYGQKIGEYDRINFRKADGSIIGYIAIESSMGTPILGGTVMKVSESNGKITDAYIEYCQR